MAGSFAADRTKFLGARTAIDRGLTKARKIVTVVKKWICASDRLHARWQT